VSEETKAHLGLLCQKNNLSEDGHYTPKHVVGVSRVFKTVVFYCRAAFGINTLVKIRKNVNIFRSTISTFLGISDIIYK
jgi:hypothetical protein